MQNRGKLPRKRQACPTQSDSCAENQPCPVQQLPHTQHTQPNRQLPESAAGRPATCPRESIDRHIHHLQKNNRAIPATPACARPAITAGTCAGAQHARSRGDHGWQNTTTPSQLSKPATLICPCTCKHPDTIPSTGCLIEKAYTTFTSCLHGSCTSSNSHCRPPVAAAAGPELDGHAQSNQNCRGSCNNQLLSCHKTRQKPHIVSAGCDYSNSTAQ